MIALRHPYLTPYLPWLGGLPREGLPDHAAMNEAFAAARAARFPEEPALRFVPSPPKKRRKERLAPIDPCDSYDGRITRDREVPTRSDDLHDFYNFVVWLAFPRAKRAIHARQLEARIRWIPAGATRIPGARTREQDALTLFDEGGVLVLGDAAPPREGALPEGTTLIAFGHALLEHFARGGTPIAATSAWLGAIDAHDPDALDRAIEARVLRADCFLEPGLDALLLLGPEGRAQRVAR